MHIFNQITGLTSASDEVGLQSQFKFDFDVEAKRVKFFILLFRFFEFFFFVLLLFMFLVSMFMDFCLKLLYIWALDLLKQIDINWYFKNDVYIIWTICTSLKMCEGISIYVPLAGWTVIFVENVLLNYPDRYYLLLGTNCIAFALVQTWTYLLGYNDLNTKICLIQLLWMLKYIYWCLLVFNTSNQQIFSSFRKNNDKVWFSSLVEWENGATWRMHYTYLFHPGLIQWRLTNMHKIKCSMASSNSSNIGKSCNSNIVKNP